MKRGLLLFWVLFVTMAAPVMAGSPKAGSSPAKISAKAVVKPAAVLKKAPLKTWAAKGSASVSPAPPIKTAITVKPPGKEKIGSPENPMGVRKGTWKKVDLPKVGQIVPVMRTVAVCPAKKNPPAQPAGPKPALLPAIRRDPGEFIDISYPLPPRAKRPAIAAARLPRT